MPVNSLDSRLLMPFMVCGIYHVPCTIYCTIYHSCQSDNEGPSAPPPCSAAAREALERLPSQVARGPSPAKRAWNDQNPHFSTCMCMSIYIYISPEMGHGQSPVRQPPCIGSHPCAMLSEHTTTLKPELRQRALPCC